MAGRNQRPIVQIPLPRFGINNKQNPYAIDESEAADLENIDITEAIAQSRMGSEIFGTTSGAGPIQNGVHFRKSDGTEQIIRARQSSIERYNTATDTWVALTLPITLTANLKVRFAVLNNLLLISNGTDSDMTYDGTTVTERASNPKTKYLIMSENRILKLSDAGVLYFSDINDPTTFDALSFINIDPNNSALGVALNELNGQPVVFKQNKPYLITSIVGGTVVPVEGGVSTVSHDSVVQTGKSLIFLGTDNWYEMSGTTIKPVSTHFDMDTLEPTMLRYAHAVLFDKKYRCFVAERSSAYNNLEIVLNLDVPTPFPDNPYAITKNRGWNGLCYIKTLTNGQEKLYFGDSRPSSGSPVVNFSYVYKMFEGFSDEDSSGPVEIDAFWEGKLYDNSVPFFSKKYNRVYTRVINASGLTYFLAYRFSTSDAWSEQALLIPESVLSWTMDTGPDLSDWLEDLEWPFEGAEDSFSGIQTLGRPRTIQFRNRVSTLTVQAQWVYQAYRYRLRQKFK